LHEILAPQPDWTTSLNLVYKNGGENMLRKRYSIEFKNQIVKEAIKVGNGSLIARK